MFSCLLSLMSYAKLFIFMLGDALFSHYLKHSTKLFILCKPILIHIIIFCKYSLGWCGKTYKLIALYVVNICLYQVRIFSIVVYFNLLVFFKTFILIIFCLWYLTDILIFFIEMVTRGDHKHCGNLWGKVIWVLLCHIDNDTVRM